MSRPPSRPGPAGRLARRRREPRRPRRPSSERLEPDTGLVVLPEAFMRDFGPPGSDLAAYAEPLDGPFVQRADRARRRTRGTTVVAGMFERQRRPGPALQHARRRGRATGCGRRTARSTSTTPSATGSPTGSLAGPVEPVLVDVGGLRVGLMTCYDLRFPELARDLVRLAAPSCSSCPSAWVAGPRQGATTGGRWRRPGRSRTPSTSPRSASPAPATPATRWSSGPPARLVAEVGDGDHVLTASVGTEGLDEARANNPSLRNRRF